MKREKLKVKSREMEAGLMESGGRTGLFDNYELLRFYVLDAKCSSKTFGFIVSEQILAALIPDYPEPVSKAGAVIP